MDKLLSCTPCEQAHVDDVANALGISLLDISLPECSGISIDDDGKITVSSLNLWGTIEKVEIEVDGDVYVSRDCGPNDKSFCNSKNRAWSGSVSPEKLKAAQELIRSTKKVTTVSTPFSISP